MTLRAVSSGSISISRSSFPALNEECYRGAHLETRKSFDVLQDRTGVESTGRVVVDEAILMSRLDHLGHAEFHLTLQAKGDYQSS